MNDVESFRSYCLSKKAVTEEFPFDAETLVFKVMGKMFAVTGLEHIPFQVSLKCDPERAIDLRDEYPEAITGAYHMNKKHWNSIIPAAIPPQLLKELIDHSYELVVGGLTRKQREQLNQMNLN